MELADSQQAFVNSAGAGVASLQSTTSEPAFVGDAAKEYEIRASKSPVNEKLSCTWNDGKRRKFSQIVFE